jgi:hypothetical protein
MVPNANIKDHRISHSPVFSCAYGAVTSASSDDWIIVAYQMGGLVKYYIARSAIFLVYGLVTSGAQMRNIDCRPDFNQALGAARAVRKRQRSGVKASNAVAAEPVDRPLRLQLARVAQS